MERKKKMLEGEAGFSPEEERNEEPTVDNLIGACRDLFPDGEAAEEGEVSFDEWAEMITAELSEQSLEEALGYLITELLESGKIDDPDDFIQSLVDKGIVENPEDQ